MATKRDTEIKKAVDRVYLTTITLIEQLEHEMYFFHGENRLLFLKELLRRSSQEEVQKTIDDDLFNVNYELIGLRFPDEAMAKFDTPEEATFHWMYNRLEESKGFPRVLKEYMLSEFAESKNNLINDNGIISQDKELLKIEEVATLLGITKASIHNWVRAGILKKYKLGTNTYFKHSEIIKAIDNSNK